MSAAVNRSSCTADARRILRGLSDETDDDVWRIVASRAAQFDEVVCSSHVHMDAFYLEPSNRLESALRDYDSECAKNRATTLRDRMSSLPEDVRVAMDVALLRAFLPQAALATVPAYELFTPGEWEHLNAHDPVEHEVKPIDLRQSVGKSVNYRGYLCVILKLTRACNLRCTYCHDWREEAGQGFHFENMTQIVRQTLSENRSAVEFVWHGGEPLMVGKKRALQILCLQDWFARPGQIVRNHIQTNGTLISTDWIKFLRVFNIRASVSLDGPKKNHDKIRLDLHGQPTWDRVRSGMRLLQDASLLSGVSIVVGESILTQGAYRFLELLQADELLDVCLIPQRPMARETGGVEQAAFIEFLCHLARARHVSHGARVAVREIDACVRVLSGSPSGFCELSGNCVGTFVTIESDGSVLHCDKYVGDPEYILGNLLERPLTDILTGPQRDQIALRSAEGLDAMSDCPDFILCQGWCPHERYASGCRDGEAKRACCGLSPLFATIRELMAEPKNEAHSG